MVTGEEPNSTSGNLDHAITWLRITHEGTLSGKHVETLIVEIERLRSALQRIASEDYRGPRPWSATVAYRALMGTSDG